MEGHTSAVYVVREGFRFWSLDKVEGLIEKQRLALSQVEGLIAKVAAVAEQSEGPLDREVQLFWEQSAELAKRVEAARAVYRELETIAAKESKLRREQ